MKKHKKLKSLIFSTFCIAFSLCFLAMPTNTKVMSAKTFAASPVSYMNYNPFTQSTVPTVNSVVSDEGGNSSTVYLYSHKSNSNTETNKFFSYYINEDKNNSSYTATEIIHSYYAGAMGVDSPPNAQFTTKLNISNNIAIAIKQGYVSVLSSAYLSSGNNGSSWLVKDQADPVTMTLFAYNSADASNKSVSTTAEGREDYVSTADVVTLSASELMSLATVDTIEINYLMTLKGQTGSVLKVKEPYVQFTTTDTTAPTLSNPTFVNQKTALPTEFSFIATDNESGLSKVEIKNGENEWETLSTFTSYTTTQNFTYSNLNGNSVLVRVTDNVGNQKVMPYVFVGVEDLYLNETFNLVSSNISNINSNNYSVYINKILNSTNVGKNTIISNSTPITVEECGSYTFEVVVADANGNVLNSYELNSLVDFNVYNVLTTATNANITASYQTKRATNQTITFSKVSANTEFVKFVQNGEVVDPSLLVENGDAFTYTFNVSENHTFEVVYREKVDISIASSYTFNANGFVPNIVVTTTDKQQQIASYDATITFYNADKTSVLETIGDVGTYVIDVVIDSASHYGSASVLVSITPKEIQITQKSASSFEFDGAVHNFDFDAEVLKDNILVSYKLGGNSVLSPVNVGTYEVELSLANENQNYTLNFKTNFEIQKRKVTVVADSFNIIYGQDVPTLTYRISNDFVGSGLAFTTTIANPGTDAKNYEISFVQATSTTPAEDEIFANFEILYTNGLLSIAKKNIVVEAENLTKVYGNDMGNNLVAHKTDIDGLLSGDTLTGTLIREAGEDVGFYDIRLGTLSNPNYNITLVPATFSITKRVAFVRIKNATMTFGEKLPTFMIDENFEKSNIIAQDLELIKASLFVNNVSGVGTYTISANTSSISNYAVVLIEAELSVMPATISIKIDNLTKTYGEIDPEFTYTVTGLVGTDAISLDLSREEGESVGSYKITINSANINNYVISNPEVSATLVIEKATPVLEVLENKTAVYNGQAQEITSTQNFELVYKYFVLGEEVANATNAGTYTVKGYFAGNANYNAAETNEATLVIEKATPVLEILENKTAVYNGQAQEVTSTQNFELVYKYFVLGEEVANATNAGTYTVKGYFAGNANYNAAETNEATLVIEKANIAIPELSNKTTVYSGAAQFIDEVNFEFELVYEYYLVGNLIANPTNAGTYSVVAKFAGNENYNEARSNTATLLIKQKIAPISMKKVVFNYNGKQQVPEFEINLDKEIEYTIKYANGVYPIEVGEYPFEIRSNDVNYVCSFQGVLKIVPEFYAESDSGNASVGSTNVSFSNSGIEIYEEINSNLSSKFNVLRDERKCVSVYAFKNITSAEGSTEVFTVKIKAKEKNKDVKIWSVDKNGNMVEVSYVEIDGYYILSVNDLSSKLIVTEADKTLFYLKITVLVLTLVLSFTISKSVKRAKANRFFRKNTVMSFTNQQELLENAQIVSSKIYKSGLTAKDILK